MAFFLFGTVCQMRIRVYPSTFSLRQNLRSYPSKIRPMGCDGKGAMTTTSCPFFTRSSANSRVITPAGATSGGKTGHINKNLKRISSIRLLVTIQSPVSNYSIFSLIDSAIILACSWAFWDESALTITSPMRSGAW